MKILISPPSCFPPGNGSRVRHWLPLLGLMLIVLLTLNASAQVITNYFGDGNGSGAEPGLDQFPGAPGNGWGNAWQIDGNGNGGFANIVTASVVNTSPLSGTFNYLQFIVQGSTPTSTKNAASIFHSVDTSVLNIFQPYTVEFDFREDGYYNGATFQTNLATSGFNSANDYVTFVQEGNTSSDVLQRRTAWWIKAEGAVTSGSPGLLAKTWGFFDGFSGGTKETSGGIWISATNVPLVCSNVYHFKVTVWPLENAYEGSVTDLHTGSNFNTTTVLGRKLKWEQFNMSSGTGGDFFRVTNIVFINKENTLANSNQISLGELVITQLPTNQWPPEVFPLVWDGTTNLAQTPGFTVGRANLKTWATTSPNYPVDTPLNFGGQYGVMYTPGFLFSGDTWFPYQSNFYFIVYSPTLTNTLPASGIKFFLNGVDVSSGLTFGGTDSSKIRTNYYSGLQDNTVYTNKIVVTDSAGASVTTLTFFNTFDTNTLIDFEAENFDFDTTQASAGTYCDAGYASSFTPNFTNRFIENWLVGGAQNNGSSGPYSNPGQSYYALFGIEGIDYQGIVGSSGAGGNFRNCMADVVINNSESSDYQRPEPFNQLLISFNETIRNVGTNMWFNYSHYYTNSDPWYIAYLRGGAFNSNWVFELDTVATGFGTSTQTSNYIGQFNLPSEPIDGQFFDYLATDATGTNTAMLNLSGLVTLKLNVVKGDIFSNGNAQFDGFELIPVPQPTITGVTNNAGVLNFAFASIPNAHYTVQYKTNLTDASWTTLTTVRQAASTSTSVTDPLGSTNRFYRVSVP